MRAVIYARFSSEKQNEASIEGQLRECLDYAKYNGIEVIGEYIDRAVSAKTDNRPDFQRMIKDSYKNAFDTVLVWKLDRFARNRYDSAYYKNILKKNGVRVISAKESISQGADGILLESILEGYAEYYSAELSQKVKRGMKETRLKGNFQGGRLLYGYKLDGRKIVINEETAPIVRYIYEEYAKGRTVVSIMNTLNENGVLYRGKPLATNTVYGILRNEKYSGTYTIGEETVANMYPQIVSTSVFEIVTSKINSNKYGRKPKNGIVYLLKDKLKCGYCGNSIIAETGSSKTGEIYYYYKCHGKKNLHNGCKQKVFRKEELEQFVIDSIIKELSKKSTMNMITKKLLAIQEQESHTSSLLNILLKEQKQTENALNNIVSAIERGIVSNATNKRLNELETHLEELERQIIVEKSKEDTKISEKDIREFYEKSLKLEPLMLINYLIREIVVYEDTIHIIYKSPLNISPDESQGFSFYQEKAHFSVQTQICSNISIDIQIIMTVK